MGKARIGSPCLFIFTETKKSGFIRVVDKVKIDKRKVGQ